MKKKLLQKTIQICEDCLDVRGQRCVNSGCVFYGLSTEEVIRTLDILQIRVDIDSKYERG